VTDREGATALPFGVSERSLKSRPNGEGDASQRLERGAGERTGRGGWTPSIIGSPIGPRSPWKNGVACKRYVERTHQRSEACALALRVKLQKVIHGESARKRLRALFYSPSRPLPRQATAAAGGVTTCTREKSFGASALVGSGPSNESSSRCR
jgi:hypothetical protein